MKKETKIKGLLLTVFFLLLTASAVMGYDYYKLTKVDTTTLPQTALNNLNHRDSYRFSLSSNLTLNNYATANTIIAGERDGRKHLHIWGKIMDTELEMFQCGTTHYRYHSPTKQWITVTDNPITQDPLLLMEILPEVNFNITDISTAKYQGKKIMKGKIYHIYTYKMPEDTHIAQEYFKEFSYKIYIEAKSKEITKTTITATSKVNEKNDLKINLTFYDINEGFIIENPI